jgi:hypothetical protein
MGESNGAEYMPAAWPRARFLNPLLPENVLLADFASGHPPDAINFFLPVRCLMFFNQYIQALCQYRSLAKINGP